MDRIALIEKLSSLFCDLSKADKRYSEVWLSDVDFGGLYKSDQYVLNVRVEHKIDNCTEEIFTIVDILTEHAKEVLGFIWRVAVYANDDSFAHCEAPLMLVYDDANACR